MPFATINAASSGDNQIVAAVAGSRIVVQSYVLKAASAVNAKFRSATTDLTGAMACGSAGDGVSSGYAPPGHFMTAAGEALNLNLSGAVQVSGHVRYKLG